MASSEATGSETMLFVTRDGAPLTVVTKARLSLTAGQAVWITPDLAQAHYFDAGELRAA